jgi:hypothetical protein
MFHSRIRSIYAVVTIFVAGCAWVAFSESQGSKTIYAGQAMNFTVEGKVNTLAQNKLTLREEGNIIFHVTYDDKTQFKNDDGSPATSKDLRVGLRIRVEGDLAESGEIAAQRIQLLKETEKK